MKMAFVRRLLFLAQPFIKIFIFLVMVFLSGSPKVNATMEDPLSRQHLQEMGGLGRKGQGDGIKGLHLIIFLRALMNLRLSSILPIVTLAKVG